MRDGARKGDTSHKFLRNVISQPHALAQQGPMLRLLSLALLLLGGPARAELADVSLLAGWRDGGRHVAGLQITLDPGWKTYWRAPGEAGIPPSFNWSGSDNLAGVEIAWPVPHLFESSGVRSVGYDGGVILPLILRPVDATRPVTLRLSLDMGVCRDVCVPLSARLSGTLPAAPARPDARIRAALADRALTASEAGVGPLTCEISPTEEGLRVAVALRLPSMGGTEHAVIEPSDPRLWVAEANVARRGETLQAVSEIFVPRGMAASLDRKALRLTVLGRRGAVEIVGCD